MNFFKTVLLVMFVNTNLYSQTILGTIIDSISKKPIEFANVTFLNKDYGVSANSDGFFKIKIDDNKDKLLISSVGFQNKIIDLIRYSEKKEYLLNLSLIPKIEEISEVLITNKKIKYSSVSKIGLKKKLKVNSGFPFGYEFCHLIKNPSRKKGKLQSVILSLNVMKNFDYLAS